MTANKAIKYGGMLAMLILAGQKVAAAAADQVLIEGVSVGTNNVTPAGVDLSIIVSIKNKLPVTVTISNIIADIKYGTAILSNLTLPSPITIEASQITDVEFTTTILFADLASNLLTLIQSGQWLNGLTIEGKVITPDLVVRINQAIHPI